MPPKSSPEIEQAGNVILGMGVLSMALGLAIAKTHETIEQIIPLEKFAGEQIMGVSGIAILFALLAKYHQNHRYQG
ncbi:MAG: hypothetical protein WC753_03170 [Candidatus Gracilibacteria bacterium]|jgi:hypothetical protein